jgi:hypothetical protein
MNSRSYSETPEREWLGVDLNAVLGASTLYALIITLFWMVEQGLPGPSSFSMYWYFFRLLGLLCVLNFLARLSGLTDFVTSRIGRGLLINTVICIALGVAWLLR